ncbi:MAG: hypothetical protein HYZ34_00985 [Ignavibacteriae bacterium]|nr:hypothetical protein [Ignavibacteriota bacterium]
MFRTEIEQLQDALIPLIEERQAYLIELTFKKSKYGNVVEVFIDADTGVTSELCTELSRSFHQALDCFGFLQSKYNLVVSSPGFDRPLKYPKQFPKHRGKKFSVKHKDGEKVVVTIGQLLDVNESGITLQLEKEQTKNFLFDDIIEAKVKPQW